MEKRTLSYFWIDTEKIRFAASEQFTVSRRRDRLVLESRLLNIELVALESGRVYAFFDGVAAGRVLSMPNIPFVKKLIQRRRNGHAKINVVCRPENARGIIAMCPDAKVYPAGDKVKVLIS